MSVRQFAHSRAGPAVVFKFNSTLPVWLTVIAGRYRVKPPGQSVANSSSRAHVTDTFIHIETPSASVCQTFVCKPQTLAKKSSIKISTADVLLIVISALFYDKTIELSLFFTLVKTDHLRICEGKNHKSEAGGRRRRIRPIERGGWARP